MENRQTIDGHIGRINSKMSDLYRITIMGDFNLTSLAWLDLPDTEELTASSSLQ